MAVLPSCEQIVAFWSSGVDLRDGVNLTMFTVSPASLCIGPVALATECIAF